MAKNQTPQIVHKLRYRYVCKHCGAENGWNDASLSGASEMEIIQKKIPEAQMQAGKGNYFDLSGISGKCQRCARRQSWELGEAKAWMKRAPLMGMGIAGIGGFMLTFLFGLIGFVVVFAIGMAVGFLCGLIMYIRVKSDVAKTANRFSPEIDWTPEADMVRIERGRA